MQRQLLLSCSAAALLIGLTTAANAQDTANAGQNAAQNNAIAVSVADSGNDNSTTDNSLNVADSGNDNSQTDNSLNVADSGNDSSTTDNSIDVADSGNDSSSASGNVAANNGSTAADNSIHVADSGNDNSRTDNSLNVADSGNDNSDNSLDIADSGNDSSTTDNSIHVADSGNDNSQTDNSDNSDNSLHISNSGNDNSSSWTDNSIRTGTASSSNLFGDGALVASATLSSYVTGVSVTFNGSADGPAADNSLRNAGSAFQNFAGMQALNQNTGAAASQNASVSVAVSTGDIAF